MGTEHEEIRTQVADLVAGYSDRCNDIAQESDSGAFLTGEKWGLSARDLVYLCYDIERVFQIEINSEDLENYRFATIDGIVETICGKK